MLLYLICALLAVGASPAAAAAQAAPAKPDTRGYTVFLRGTPIGREEITVSTDAGGVVISGHGRLSPPLDIVTRRAQVRYAADWSPISLVLEGVVQLRENAIHVAFAGGEAKVDSTLAGQAGSKVDKVSPQTLVLPNGFFGFHEAVARRLATVTPPAELRAYIAPQVEIALRVGSVVNERVQTGSTAFGVRRYDLVFANPGGDLPFQLSADESGRLIRVTIPAQSIDVVRDDVAASTSRTQIYSNPGDEAITIPGSGFNIAGTVTKPKSAAERYPAVVLLPGSGVGDRDGVAAGVPILGQLAGALADAGHLTVRYDKRGYGQTGGRAESATLSDFAEDVRAAVRYLEKRKDVDPKRIVIVGHSEGAWVALLAALREKKIAGVVSIAAPATTGAELVLEQQRHALDQMNVPDAERQAKVELQKKIQEAVITGKGWEGIPPDLRKQADSAWFQSLLTFDPAKVVNDVRQPLLIVHGELDRQVPVAHADKLAELAKAGKSRAVEVITVRGINHLLVPATTGEVSEYGSLTDRNVSKDVTKTIADWLAKTFRTNPNSQ
jgi:pimeloyl-ACP methyl ester carboxylesterase